ncbi:MAG: DUF177 domain-containing protein [Actinomycetota bacterium]|nr:DUF177 domain-containing protein [Actinomycetota bacterium]
MTSFRVNVADLVHRPSARRHERVTGHLEGLRVVDTGVEARADVVVDAVLEWVSDGLLARGTVSAPWQGPCRRCLVEVHGHVEAGFQELFEAEPREGESYALRHDHVDFEPLAREVLLLELPLAPLCQEACAGLCPLCGADRNREPCGHQTAERDPRWAALDELHEDTE